MVKESKAEIRNKAISEIIDIGYITEEEGAQLLNNDEVNRNDCTVIKLHQDDSGILIVCEENIYTEPSGFIELFEAIYDLENDKVYIQEINTFKSICL